MGKRALGVKEGAGVRVRRRITILNDLTCRDLQKREVASIAILDREEHPDLDRSAPASPPPWTRSAIPTISG